MERIVGDGTVEIAGLAYDSRRVGPGALFFCVPGEKVDGHEFAAAVVEAGAVALVVERELEVGVPQVVVGDARAAMAPVAARFFGDPTAELRVVGVTGTNGKTTTAFLIREILEAAGVSCGLLGTVKQVVGGVEEERRADDAGGDRPAGDVPADARRRGQGLRDGGLLARDVAAPGRRDPLRGGAVHQPHPGPPRLPRRHGGLLRRQAQAVRQPGSGDGDRQRRRSLRPPPRRRIRVRHLLRRGRRGRLQRPRGQLRRQRRPIHHRPAGSGVDGPKTGLLVPKSARRRGGGGADWAAGALQRGQCAGGVRGGGGARGRGGDRGGRAGAGGAGAGALRADRRGAGVRGPGRLRAHAGLAARTCCGRRGG